MEEFSNKLQNLKTLRVKFTKQGVLKNQYIKSLHPVRLEKG